MLGYFSRLLKRGSNKSFDEIDRKVVAEIRQRGDDGKRVRDVIHYTGFQFENFANQFAEEIEAKGFHSIRIEQRDSEPGKHDQFVVVAHHDSTLMESDLGERLFVIRDLADRFAGVHGGWEAACYES